ncbi:hypothetical protein J2Y40_003154 [Chryseobacterium sp. 2987]|nr:hypothetical protein [Chryseobacterium sp. 2987]
MMKYEFCKVADIFLIKKMEYSIRAIGRNNYYKCRCMAK